MILACICGLAYSPGKEIVQLLQSLGLQGVPLFPAALAISVLIVGVSYLIATWGIKSKKKGA
ncbi:MAG: hypothetical protein JWQ87_1960 [Candidatus Sulfotelmatobacter sp.]|nr:hypothetical protein [Candidatus Sulfotelmatobacter sp.]